MTVSAAGASPGLAALLAAIAAPLEPPVGASAAPSPRAQDLVTLSPGAGLRGLPESAVAGTHLLDRLLPVLARALDAKRAELAPLPVAHLAKAVKAAVERIGDGASDVDGEVDVDADRPDAMAIDRWRGQTKEVLRTASDLLAKVDERLRLHGLTEVDSADRPPTISGTEIAWALGQIAATQRQVGMALLRLEASPARARRSGGGPIVALPTWRLESLHAPIAAFGAGLLICLLYVAVEFGLTGTLVAGAAAATFASLVWKWRVVVASRGLRIEGVRHPSRRPQ